MKFSILSWGHGAEGGNLRNPEWHSIDEKLKALEIGVGAITLDCEEDNGFQKSLQVRFENGNYLLTFGYETEDDWVVLTYKNDDSVSEEIALLGDVWRNNCICRNPAIVRLAFNHFFCTGTVPDVFMKT